MIQIAVYSNDKELDKWLAAELQQKGVGILSQPDSATDLGDATAILCIALDEPARAETLHMLANQAIDAGKTVIWAVSDSDSTLWTQVAEEFRDKEQYVVEDLDENVAPVLDMINLYIEQAKGHPAAKKRKFVIPTASSTTTSNDRTRDFQVQTSKPARLIAVGGHAGCGSSFVAMNMAALLGATLIEGRSTGTLAKWTGSLDVPNARSSFLQTGTTPKTLRGIPLAVTAIAALTADEVEQLRSFTDETFVIDVGNDMNSPAWQSASDRVFVTIPDPQYADHPFDEEATVRVMNRFPTGFFNSNADEIFKTKVHLVVPDMTNQVLTSLWGNAPLLLEMPTVMQEEWKSAFGAKGGSIAYGERDAVHFGSH